MSTETRWHSAAQQAWERLCHGTDGEYVRDGERWPAAIARHASELMAERGHPWPHQFMLDPQLYMAPVMALARQPSCAEDGKVQGNRRRRARTERAATQKGKRPTNRSGSGRGKG